MIGHGTICHADRVKTLHAADLGFVHPRTAENLKFSVPLPKDLQQFISRLKKMAGSK